MMETVDLERKEWIELYAKCQILKVLASGN